MSTIKNEDFVNNFFTLFIETFESPPRPSSAYLDQKAGLFDTLEHVSAEQASKPIHGIIAVPRDIAPAAELVHDCSSHEWFDGATIRGNAISIASQVEHLRFYMGVLEEFMDGRTEKVNWEESWQLKTVTPETWLALKQNVKTTYERVSQKFKRLELWQDDEIGDSMAILVHSAYHLGAIRQMVKAL